MITVDNYNFHGKRAIVRIDANVPLDSSFNVTDDTRIIATIKTVKKILTDGGAVILMTHLGRPKNGQEDKFSLNHIIPTLEKYYDQEVFFAGDCIGENAQKMCNDIKMGEIILLENLRFYNEEKSGDKEFAKKLASYADCYVNDAFGTAHRAHASTAIIAEFFPNDKMIGYVITNELQAASKVMDNPKRPYIAIVGGSKVSSKITVIEKLLEKVDKLIIGGGMMFTIEAAKGGKVGKSLCEPDQFDTAIRIIEKAKKLGVELILAKDTLCGKEFSNETETIICPASNVEENYMGMDIGPEASSDFANAIEGCKTILWNGPMGVFEFDKFTGGSIAVAKAIVKATENGAYSLIGGGDSVACVTKLGYTNNVSYNSTGGGALLEYLEGATLPGLSSIKLI